MASSETTPSNALRARGAQAHEHALRGPSLSVSSERHDIRRLVPLHHGPIIALLPSPDRRDRLPATLGFLCSGRSLGLVAIIRDVWTRLPLRLALPSISFLGLDDPPFDVGALFNRQRRVMNVADDMRSRAAPPIGHMPSVHSPSVLPTATTPSKRDRGPPGAALNPCSLSAGF